VQKAYTLVEKRGMLDDFLGFLSKNTTKNIY
jgi:hypothetical protein